MKPGPRMGEILKAVYEQQMDGKVTKEELVEALRGVRETFTHIADIQRAALREKYGRSEEE